MSETIQKRLFVEMEDTEQWSHTCSGEASPTIWSCYANISVSNIMIMLSG